MATEPNRADLQRRLGLHDNDYKRLEELAAQNDRTVVAEIRRAVRVYLEGVTATAKEAVAS